jgi:hypothetical protein
LESVVYQRGGIDALTKPENEAVAFETRLDLYKNAGCTVVAVAAGWMRGWQQSGGLRIQ